MSIKRKMPETTRDILSKCMPSVPKKKAQRLVQIGQLTETYFNCADIEIAKVEKLLQEIVLTKAVINILNR